MELLTPVRSAIPFTHTNCLPVNTSPTKQISGSPFSHFFYPVLALACAAYFWWAYGRLLENPDHFNDDVVQHYLWLMDTSAWPDDFYARTARTIQPWGFRGLLALLGAFFDPIPISRYAPLLVVGLNAGFGAAILRRYYHPVYALAGGVMVAHFALASTVGFNARAFCVPLLIIFGYYLTRKDSWKQLGLVLVICPLFYPPSLLINLGIGGLWFLYLLVRERRWPRESWPVVAGTIIGILIAYLQSRAILGHPDLGAMMSWDTMKSMNEFRGGGRVDFTSLLTQPSMRYFRYFISAFLSVGDGRWFAYLIVASALLIAVVQRRKTAALSGWLFAYGIATMVLFRLAKATAPLLFLPDRYVAYPWRPFAALLLIFCVGSFLVRWPKRWLVAPLTVLVLAYGYRFKTPDRVGMERAERKAEFYSTIEALPDTVLIAGPPVLMDQVMLYTRQPVLVTNESSHALYFENYYAYVTPRLKDQMRAYAAPADSIDQVLDFARKYGVDYLVVQPDALQEGKARTFDPHAKWFKKRTEGRDSTDFALLAIPQSLRQDIEGGKYFLLKTEDLDVHDRRITDTPTPATDN